MNLEFGGGEDPRCPEYLQVDVRPLEGIDYVCNAWEIYRLIKADSVDNIYSRHFFEHLTFIQGRETMLAWHKILKQGGCVEMVIPNMEFHINQWLNEDNMEWACQGFWGKQRDGMTETWDIHKSGYTPKLLKHLGFETGFTKFEEVPDLPKNTHVKFYK